MAVMEMIEMTQDQGKGKDEDKPSDLLGDRLIKPPEVALMLGVHKATVVEWLRNGTLPGIRLPGNAGWRVRSTDLTKWLLARTRGLDDDHDDDQDQEGDQGGTEE